MHDHMDEDRDAILTQGGEGGGLSPWQQAKRLAVESAGASAEGGGFGDDGLVMQWLVAQVA